MAHDDPAPAKFEPGQPPRPPAAASSSLRASILAGPDVHLIDVSPRTLLLESDVRLTPGVGVSLNVTRDDQLHLVSGRISRVDAALVGGRIKYRAEVALDREMAIFELERDDVAALPSPAPVASVERPDAYGRPEYAESELDNLRHELQRYRDQCNDQQRALDTAHEALASGELLRNEIVELHAAEQAAWRDEQRLLEDRLREAERRAAHAERDLDAARDNERTLVREHERDRAKLEASIREREQRLADLEAAHAALQSAAAQDAEAFERERSEWKLQQERVASQLQTAETWCADQQEFLSRMRLEMGRAFTLIEGSAAVLPPESREKPSLPPASTAIEAIDTIRSSGLTGPASSPMHIDATTVEVFAMTGAAARSAQS